MPKASHGAYELLVMLMSFCVDLKFVKLLPFRSKRVIHCEGLSDIFDGKVYKNSADFFVNKFALSVMLNYDGAPKFKSSGMQIWPVQLSINELAGMFIYVSIHIICLS